MTGDFGRAITPFHQSGEFLDAHGHRAMLDWAMANRERFQPALIAGGIVDPTQRLCETLLDLGPMETVLKRRFEEMLQTSWKNTLIGEFRLDSIELNLAAHGDGAHFAAHRDTFSGEARLHAREAGHIQHDRMLSAVYYFHREPKGFSGGELRLHPFSSAGGQGGHVDIQPLQNSVVAFPSFIFHEVRPVHCPSQAFEDYRFAVNCWFCTDLETGSTQ